MPILRTIFALSLCVIFQASTSFSQTDSPLKPEQGTVLARLSYTSRYFWVNTNEETYSPSPDNSAIVGVWTGKMDSLPTMTLTVEEENGKLIGAVLFYLIRRNPSGPPTASPGIPEPLINPSFDGKTLTFKVSHRHAHAGTEHDPPVGFQFELNSSGKLTGVNHEGPPVELVRDTAY